MKDVDFGRQSRDYAVHRPGFPPSFYSRLETFANFDNSRVVDIGTGPGVMALEMAKGGADVTGVDISENQVQVASERTRAASLTEHCRFRVATAEDAKLEEGAFNWVTAGQCWHWFESTAALREVERLLKLSGLLVIAHYSYLASRSEVARLSEELILRQAADAASGKH